MGDIPGIVVSEAGACRRDVLGRLAGIPAFVRVTTTLSAELLRRRFLPPWISSSSVFRPPKKTEISQQDQHG